MIDATDLLRIYTSCFFAFCTRIVSTRPATSCTMKLASASRDGFEDRRKTNIAFIAACHEFSSSTTI